MRRNRGGFTLIEIAISVFIMLLLLALSVPSLTGVMADRRLRRSLDDLSKLVHQAQERSVADRRPYLIAWRKDHLVLQPEALAKGEKASLTATMQLRKGDAFLLTLPAALTDHPPAEWVFWPSGTCEPAIVSFKGVDGSWTAKFSSLTARPEVSNYAAK
ncbi:MAG TPA: prepilin-type N-terminal cleavage/methylation domain-containing protein [Chthoniobacterales bacterium]|nr:prepilin-type N-terminal cleavage/methylation domain-containing protein [Chthoniobacterales bacterium]